MYEHVRVKIEIHAIALVPVSPFLKHEDDRINGSCHRDAVKGAGSETSLSPYCSWDHEYNVQFHVVPRNLN
jgi:hypothetical protein